MDLFDIAVASKLAGGGGGDEPVLIDKTITANGTYNASSDNADGYKKAIVSIPIITYYIGSTEPSSSLGIDGDIYLKVVS